MSEFKINRPKEYDPNLVPGADPRALMADSLGLDASLDEGDGQDYGFAPGTDHEADLKAEQSKQAANLAEIKRLRTELLHHAENSLLAERKNANSLLEIKKISDSRIAHMKKQAEETIHRHVADLDDLKDVCRQQEIAISKMNSHTALMEETLRAKGIQAPSRPQVEAELSSAASTKEAWADKRIAQLEAEVKRLTALASANVGQSNGLATQSSNSYAAENASLRQQLDAAAEKLRNLNLQAPPNSEASALLEKERILTASLNSQIKQLQADLRSKVAEIQGANQSQSSASSSQIAALDAKIQNLASENAALKSEIDRLQQDAIKASAESELERRRFAAVTQQNSSTQEQLSALQRKNGQLQAAVQVLSTCKSVLKQNFVTLRRSLSQQKEKVLALQNQQQALFASFAVDLNRKVSKYITENSVSIEQYKNEVKLRRKYFNMVQQLKGNIRVYCRVRPLAADEAEDCVRFPDENELEFWDAERSTFKSFEFERVFLPSSTQEEVFDDVSGLIQSCMDGFSVCMFAYGQTGSGKTFTMEGTAECRGVNPRSMQLLFERITQSQKEFSYTVSMSMLEIYNESIRDLLALPADRGKSLEVRQGPQGNHVPDCRLEIVTSVEAVNELWLEGSRNRSVASTNMNEHSSRSHLIVSVVVEGVNLATGIRTFGAESDAALV
jgi:kinesin family protein C2/C3